MISIENRYNTPRFLLSVTLLFWGYQSDMILISVLMAFMLELKEWTNKRIELEEHGFYMLGNISTALFIIIILVSLFGSQAHLFIHQIVIFLPIVFYPLLISEQFSVKQQTPVGAFIYSFRKRKLKKDIKMGYFYFSLILLASSIDQSNKNEFFIILAILISWALWQVKPRSNNNVKWLLVMVLVIAVSFKARNLLMDFALDVEHWAIDYFDQLFHGERDPFRSRTAMGQIGQLKLSNKIMLRVKSRNNQPILLEEAIYDSFYSNVWFSTLNKFTDLDTKIDLKNNKAVMTVHRNTRDNYSLLALPLGQSDIAVATKVELSRNGHGTTKAIYIDDLFEYKIYPVTEDKLSHKSAPTNVDLIIPRSYRKIIKKIELQQQLTKLDHDSAILAIANYFKENYRYSLFQEKIKSEMLPLVNFLTDSHRGHCEFFASATVLLLRSANIPARYVVGYSVSEYDSTQKLFIVRARDSHAWAQAYINNRWINVDNTPSVWYQQESENASVFEPITDFMSTLFYKYNIWRKNNSVEDVQFYIVIVIVIVVLLIILYRCGNIPWFQTAVRIKALDNKHSIYDQKVDRDSQVLMDKIINQSNVSRYSHEPLWDWYLRYTESVNNNLSHTYSGLKLKDIINLYYEIRFSNCNSNTTVLHEFEKKVNLWLVIE